MAEYIGVMDNVGFLQYHNTQWQIEKDIINIYEVDNTLRARNCGPSEVYRLSTSLAPSRPNIIVDWALSPGIVVSACW